MQKLKEQKQKESAEEEEKKRKDQHAAEWTARIAKLEKEEKEMLNLQSTPFRSYLMEQIMPTVAEGLVKLLTEGSSDPVQYLVKL